MKTISINLYEYSELSDEAKEKAKNELNLYDDFHRNVNDDIENYFKPERIEKYGLELDEYQYDVYSNAYDFDIRIYDVEKFIKSICWNISYDMMKALQILPIWYNHDIVTELSHGYEIDYEKKTTKTRFYTKVFNDFIHDFIEDIKNDIKKMIKDTEKHVFSDEYMIDLCEANNYMFLKNGEFYYERKF